MTPDEHDGIDVADGSSSSLRHLKELHARKPRVDLRAAKEHVARNQPIDHLRTETNAILSLFIEDIWKQVRQYTSHNAAIVRPRTAADIAAGDSALLTPMSEAELTRRCTAAGDYALVVSELDECTKPIVFAMINRWQEGRFERLDTRAEHERDASDRAFMRLLHILNEVHAERLDDLGANPWMGRDPAALRKTLLKSFAFGSVAQGFVTAREIILGTLAVAPDVYRNQFNKAITPAQMAEIANNLKALVLMLAADDLASHVSIATFLMIGEPEERLRTMDPCMFFIARPRGKLTLEVNDEVLRVAMLAQNPDEPRTGCPALESIGPTGRNVVTELYEWYLDLAKRFYVPQIDRLGRA